MFAWLLRLLIAVLLVLNGYVFYKYLKYRKEPVPEPIELHEVVSGHESDLSNRSGNGQSGISIDESAPVSDQEKKSDLPEELNLEVPFYAQAPFGNWDYPWQEACEEASVLLVANVYLNKGWSKKQFNDQILEMVEWEKNKFGAYEHTTVAQTAQILGEIFNLETNVHENPSYQQVKEILAKGHLVIMTFAGKKLGNPFYRNGGPVYHAMVIKGYKQGEKLITNDVGTRRGADYVYPWDVIQDALHDYDEPIENGAKFMIEVLPPE